MRCHQGFLSVLNHMLTLSNVSHDSECRMDDFKLFNAFKKKPWKPVITWYCLASLNCVECKILCHVCDTEEQNCRFWFSVNASFVSCFQWRSIEVWHETNPSTVVHLSYHLQLEPASKPPAAVPLQIVQVGSGSSLQCRTPQRQILDHRSSWSRTRNLEFVLGSSRYACDLPRQLRDKHTAARLRSHIIAPSSERNFNLLQS